jgi:hypothetical protein
LQTKLQCQPKKKSPRDRRGKNCNVPSKKKIYKILQRKNSNVKPKKSGKPLKPTPGASCSLHIKYLTSGTFCYKKQALTPKQIQEGKD